MGRAQPGSTGIFNKDDYKTVIAERRRLNELITTMDKAEQCGVNCAIWRQQRNDLDHQYAMVQQNFMNPPPS